MANKSADSHWFEAMADHLGDAYLRYSFTRGSAQEVEFLVDVLGLEPGMRVLDVGCGPGRHATALAAQGILVHGIDISQRFVDIANAANIDGATFERCDARSMRFDAEFDAAISLCQGAFGLAAMPGGPVPTLDPDGVILTRMAQALRPGSLLAVSAFSAYFQVQYLEDRDAFDADHGVNHERTSLLNEAAESLETDLWTSCFTPRELRLLSAAAGLKLGAVWSVTPGKYRRQSPTIETPEFLMIASRPEG